MRALCDYVPGFGIGVLEDSGVERLDWKHEGFYGAGPTYAWIRDSINMRTLTPIQRKPTCRRNKKPGTKLQQR